jgi:hypothetical protein
MCFMRVATRILLDMCVLTLYILQDSTLSLSLLILLYISSRILAYICVLLLLYILAGY